MKAYIHPNSKVHREMMKDSPEDPLERYMFTTRELVSAFPPVWRNRNKEVVYGISSPPGSPHSGEIVYSRWRAMALPVEANLAGCIDGVVKRNGFYDYEPLRDPPGSVEWHVNFADPHLFVAYGGSLFAQDEMQVAEHPGLGSLREALLSQGASAVTAELGNPTPVLVTGVERRCSVSTGANAKEGRLHGLYGNQFARATAEAVKHAVRRIDPPTITNIIAMAAPGGGYGRYHVNEVRGILVTAYTGFRAAVLESQRVRGGGPPVVVHTGFWGCGAFGGNRILMAILQILASRLAGLGRLVFHAGDTVGVRDFEEACRVASKELSGPVPTRTDEMIDKITSMGFQWGESDGN